MDFNSFEVPVRESHGVLDTDIEYLWEIAEITIKDVVIRGDYKGSTMDELSPQEREDVPAKHHSVIMEVTSNVGADLDLNANIRTSFWVNELRYNEENPDYTSALLTFIRRLGHNPTLKDAQDNDVQLKPSAYFNVGTKFKAHAVAQKSKDGKETGFHELNVTTVKPVEGGAPNTTEQGVILGVVSGVLKQQVIDFVKNFKTKDEAMMAMANTAGMSQNIGMFISMCNDGEIKF